MKHIMTAPCSAPYGAWKSPITSDLIVAGAVGLGGITADGDSVYWLESRPTERGRSVLVRRGPNGQIADLTPPPFNVRTRVHEYGGGEYLAAGDEIFFVNFADQRVYRLGAQSDEAPQPITPELPLRYADFVLDRGRGRLICVREDHRDPDAPAVNTIVGLDLAPEDGRSGRFGAQKRSLPSEGGQVLVSGNDFYASPRLSPDGTRLAWLTWHNPNMPWDGTELWVGALDEAGAIEHADLVAGGPEESIFQPEWSPEGVLHFVSDRTGWWNLYRWQAGRVEPLAEMTAEFGLPQWVFGMSTYAFVDSERLACAYTEAGAWRLALLDTVGGTLTPFEIPYTEISNVRCAAGCVYFLGGAPDQPAAVVMLDLATQRSTALRRSSDIALAADYLARPRLIEFPTAGGLTAFGYFYPPCNRDYAAPAGEKPPLLVFSHGGPTGNSGATLRLSIQYWTSRGFAVLDVNYGGSTGYGRAYRERLNGAWGVVDVDDCVNGARYLAEQGEVDPDRLAIRGGSAGGYTTLCALTFRDVFRAGASHYGIGDLEALARDTHKFEARYLDRLVGPYPERRDLYVARSPIHFTERLSCPVIFFQGLDDKVVPPNQAEAMFAAVRAKGLPTAYLAFEGEGHGFRRAENIKRVLDAELYFYSRVFGFELADPIEPVAIENLRSRTGIEPSGGQTRWEPKTRGSDRPS